MNCSFSINKKYLIFVSLLGINFAQVVIAQKTQPGWTPEVMSKFKRVGGTAISPDGQLIAYTVSEPILDKDHSEYLTHIWVVSTDGVSNRQFTRGKVSATNPAFSPDGSYLSFLSARDESGKNQIWLLHLEGGEAEQITNAETGIEAYAWSPDGKRIAFTTNEHFNGGEYKRSHLYTMTLTNISGDGAAKRLTFEPSPITDFDWSPGGQTIAFEHTVSAEANQWPTTDISTVSVDSGTVTPLIAFNGMDMCPRYSPDGKWLAFISEGGEPKSPRAMDIHLIPAQGGAIQKLAESWHRRPQLVGWSADSRQIYFTETDYTNHRLFALPTNGKPPQAVTPATGNFTNVSISKNARKIALIHQTSDLPPDVYVTAKPKFTLTKLTEVHADYPKFRLGRTEAIKWKSRSGDEIEGLLTYPVNYVLDRLHPLILIIDEGATAAYTQTYTARRSVYPIQAFAQEGYAILRPMFRSSQNRDDFGDYEDLIAGANKVMNLGIAHPDSLCIMGWDQSGFMTCFIISKTNRFKVASIGAGGSGYFFDPGKQKLQVPSTAAIFNADNVNTATQIIYVEGDESVPLSLGLDIYDALQERGIPTEIHVYPKTMYESHEPEMIQEIGKRIIAWFNSKLGRKKKLEPVVTK
jgi:dipeptidyl aminopeptidase/acylaminoacyl peptidase